MLDRNHPDNDVTLDAFERSEFDMIAQDFERQARNVFLGKFFGLSFFGLIVMAVVACAL